MVGFNSVQDSVQFKPVGFNLVQYNVQSSVQRKPVGFNSVQDSVQSSVQVKPVTVYIRNRLDLIQYKIVYFLVYN